jgi:hypothetical protein
MKAKSLWVAMFVGVGPLTALARFNMPPKSYTSAQMAEAAETARRERKPIAFLVTDLNTDCPLAEDASKEIIKRMRGDTVLVYCPVTQGLPEGVKKVIRGQIMGRYYPYVVVTDPEMTRLLGFVRYEDIDASASKAFRDVEKAIKEFLRNARAAP